MRTTLRHFSALATCLLLIPDIGGAADLPVVNPGFEDGPTGWSLGTDGPCMSPGFAGAIYDSATAGGAYVHSGRYSLRETFNSNKTWQIISHPIRGGCNLTLSAWVKMPTQGSPQTKVLSLDFQGMNASGTCIWGRTSFPEFGGPYADWTLLSVSLVAPSDAVAVLVNIHTQNGFGCGGICNAPLWVDDVSLFTECATVTRASSWGRVKAIYGTP